MVLLPNFCYIAMSLIIIAYITILQRIIIKPPIHYKGKYIHTSMPYGYMYGDKIIMRTNKVVIAAIMLGDASVSVA